MEARRGNPLREVWQAMMNRDHATEIRRLLTDPIKVVMWLGLAKGAKRQPDGASVLCPSHSERSPSCSVSKGPDGSVRVKCFSCGFAGDLFTLVARVRGLDPRNEFRAVMSAAAEMGGLHEIADELRNGEAPAEQREMPARPEPAPAKEYPPQAEVLSVWQNAVPVRHVPDCHAALEARGLSPDRELARALDCEAEDLPRWCKYQGQGWLELGYRVVLPVYDHLGELRSLRAWRIGGDPSMPKRLPPSGMRGTGVVLASPELQRCLREPGAPIRLLIAEGEPDFLALCQRYPAAPVAGVFSGSWSDDFAARIPFGSRVSIRTHEDPAGEAYAAKIAKSLSGRASVLRCTN